MKPLLADLVVNGERISATAIAAEAQNHDAPSNKPGWAWRKAARALAVRALLLQEAARQGLAPAPRDLGGGRRETEDEAMIRLLLESVLSPEPPSEIEIRAVYDAKPGRFRSPAVFEAAHILFAVPPGDADARTAALSRANAVLALLRREPEAFDDVAREESDCPSRAAGGRLGQITPGDTVPEFEAELVRLSPGEIAPQPVETPYGIHVVRLDARDEGTVLPYEAVRRLIVTALERKAWVRAAGNLVERLAEQAEISGIDLRPAQGPLLGPSASDRSEGSAGPL